MPESKTYGACMALVGSPNVGKSTLLNRVLGKKISIISDKPQTTRSRILGIFTKGNRQILFLDAPGKGKPIGRHSTHMNRIADNITHEADIILWMLDAKRGILENDRKIQEDIKYLGKPIVAIFNKMDITVNEQVIPLVDALQLTVEIKEFFPISAKTGDNVDKLMHYLLNMLPENPMIYDSHEITDQSDEFVIAEFVREQIFINFRKEIPYFAGVQVDEVTKKDMGLDAEVTVFVQNERHRKILIGAGGQGIKKFCGEKGLGGPHKVKLILQNSIT
jgi:GTP-binding protein Era